MSRQPSADEKQPIDNAELSIHKLSSAESQSSTADPLTSQMAGLQLNQSEPSAATPATPAKEILADSKEGSPAFERKLNPLTLQRYSAKYYRLLETRKKLPVYIQREEFESKLRSNQVLIVTGDCGAGKSTQVC